MDEMVEARRLSEKEDEHHDLFHLLLAAADAENNPLTNEELYGKSMHTTGIAALHLTPIQAICSYLC